MKPLHMGWLLAGVVLAGGLAVKLSQPEPIPVQAPEIQPPGISANVPAKVPAVVRAPAAVAPRKPSPIPAAPRIERASAPEPVYNEPPPKVAIRKFKPISPASVSSAAPVLVAKVKPTQWSPARYEAPPAAPITPVASEPAGALVPAVVPAVIPAVMKEKPPSPRHVTLETGMTVPVRLDEAVSRTSAGDSFQASLVEPLVVDGLVIAERGARVTGRVRSASLLELGLATLSTSDGQRVAVATDPWTYGQAGTIAGGTIIRFRLTSKLTITEQQIAGK
jgi:hypothetical protein